MEEVIFPLKRASLMVLVSLSVYKFFLMAAISKNMAIVGISATVSAVVSLVLHASIPII